MNKELQQILIDIFPLVVEVNFNTEYKVYFSIQPCWDSLYQVWYQVTDHRSEFGHTETAFWLREDEFKIKMAEFKNELLEILGNEKMTDEDN